MGNHFFSASYLSCIFGGLYITAGAYISSSAISCKVPPIALENDASSQILTVEVAFENTRYLSPSNFTVYGKRKQIFVEVLVTIELNFKSVLTARPTIEATVPSFVVGTNDDLLVLGTNFRKLSSLTCRFESSATQYVNAVFVNSTAVRCRVPTLQNPNLWIALSISLNDQPSGIRWEKDVVLVRYAPPPIVMSVYPPFGSVLGGTIVRVTAEGLDNLHRLQCDFGKIGASPIRIVSSSSGECVVPTRYLTTTQTTSFQLFITQPSKMNLISVPFQLFQTFDVTQIFPAAGMIYGGDNIVVNTNGRDLLTLSQLTNIYCLFGEIRVPSVVLNASSISCVNPPLVTALSVLLRISTGIIDHLSIRGVPFTFMAPVTLINISPGRASAEANTTIVVNVDGVLHDGVVCVFGSGIASASILSFSTLKCVTPAHADSVVLFRLVMRDGSNVSMNAFPFEFYNPPAINEILPSSRILHPNSTTALLASNFSSDMDIQCVFNYQFESMPAMSSKAKIISENRAECLAPDTSTIHPLDCNLSVIIDGTFIVRDESFTITQSPRILAISPRRGTVSGGNFIKVTVDDEAIIPNANYSCMIGNSIMAVIPTQLRSVFLCKTPQVSFVGQYQLSISANGFDYFGPAHPGDAFFDYVAVPTVYSFWPQVGSFRGGTRIIVSASDVVVDMQLQCLFSNAARVAAVMINLTAVMCQAPPDVFSLGYANVSLTDYDGAFERRFARPFLYLEDVTIESVYPSTIPSNYNQMIRIKAQDLVFSDTLSCRIGNGSAVLKAGRVSSAEVDCDISPIVPLSPGNTSVSVSLNGQEWSENFAVTIMQPFEMKSVFPKIISRAGINDIYVTVGGLSTIYPVACIIGGISVPASLVNDTVVKCRVPLCTDGNELDVIVSGFDGLIALGVESVHLVTTPDISMVTPMRGSVFGQTIINITTTQSISSLTVLCCFNETICSDAFLASSTVAQCITPPATVGWSRLHLALGDSSTGYVNSTDTLFYFFAVPMITGISPQQLIASEETVLTIIGEDFVDSSDLLCGMQFETNRVNFPALWRSSQVIQCFIGRNQLESYPSHAQVMLSFNGQDFLNSDLNVTFVQEPDMHTVEWNFGSNGDGLISMVGNSFVPDMKLFCRFRSPSQATSVAVQVSNSTLVQCLPPSWTTARNVSVSLWTLMNNKIGQEKTLSFSRVGADSFAWSMAPDYGSVNGNTRINIKVPSQMFVKDNSTWTCCFNQSCTPLLNNQGQLWCQTPPVSFPGVVPVTLESELMPSGPMYWFQYLSEPTVLAMYPPRGSFSGGDKIRITGEGFSLASLVKCKFGGILSDAMSISDTDVICLARQRHTTTHLSETVAFGLVYSDSPNVKLRQMKSNDFLSFEYAMIPRLFNATAKASTLDLAAKTTAVVLDVIVSGDNFANLSTVACRLSSEVVDGIQVDSNTVRCLSSAYSEQSKEIDISISNDGLLFSNVIKTTISTKTPLQLSLLHPSFGLTSGGNIIWVIGQGFDDQDELECVFGWGEAGSIQPFRANVANYSHVRCIVDQWRFNAPFETPVSLRSRVRQAQSNFLFYRYVDPVEITGMYPYRGIIGVPMGIQLTGVNFFYTTMSTCKLSSKTGSEDTSIIAPAK